MEDNEMMSKVQRMIASIAHESWNRGERMTVNELSSKLKSAGLKPGKGRGLFSQITSTLHRAIKEKNQGIADCIANCFANNKGEHVWKKRKS